jgi:OFA family oxalate/formate antiporter-like MFS transporter
VYVGLFLIMGVACSLLPVSTTFAGFAGLAFMILLCFGGGLGAMPAFAADHFGEKNVGAIYGQMLAVWRFSSVPSPLLMASVRESTGSYNGALYLIGAVALASALLPLVLRPPQPLVAAAATTKRAATTPRAISVPGRCPKGQGADLPDRPMAHQVRGAIMPVWK